MDRLFTHPNVNSARKYGNNKTEATLKDIQVSIAGCSKDELLKTKSRY
jgi:hypothetical protein